MRTEEVKLILFKRKKELKTVEGKEEQKIFEEERHNREVIVKNVIQLNKILVEERIKKEEEGIILLVIIHILSVFKTRINKSKYSYSSG
jgi:hypothetical protein